LGGHRRKERRGADIHLDLYAVPAAQLTGAPLEKDPDAH
jgi:hypothetical protein